MIRLLTILSIVLVILLFPPATLALISNNAVPGDATYPIKRGLEDVIYKVASVNPVTQAWFSAARSDRRFQEVTVLVAEGKQADQTLNELVQQTRATATQISQIKDPVQKEQLISQLSTSIQKYDQGLQRLDSQSQPSSAQQQVTPTSAPLSSTNSLPSPVNQVSPTPAASNVSEATPTPVGSPVAPQPSPTSVSIPSPSPAPLPPPPVPPQTDCSKIQNELEKAECELENIRNGLHANSQMNAPAGLPTNSTNNKPPLQMENNSGNERGTGGNNLTPARGSDKINQERR